MWAERLRCRGPVCIGRVSMSGPDGNAPALAQMATTGGRRQAAAPHLRRCPPTAAPALLCPARCSVAYSFAGQRVHPQQQFCCPRRWSEQGGQHADISSCCGWVSGQQCSVDETPRAVRPFVTGALRPPPLLDADGAVLRKSLPATVPAWQACGTALVLSSKLRSSSLVLRAD